MGQVEIVPNTGEAQSPLKPAERSKVTAIESLGPASVQQPVLADFGSEAERPVCSWNQCQNGHKWDPTVRLAGCPGCGKPVLMVKMVNCPFCNEPVSKLTLRSDHTAQGGTVNPLCQGAPTLSECTAIEMIRGHAAAEQASYKERVMVEKL